MNAPKHVHRALNYFKKMSVDMIIMNGDMVNSSSGGNAYNTYNMLLDDVYGNIYLLYQKCKNPGIRKQYSEKMQKVIDEQGLPDVVFHSIRHTSVTYKLKLSGGDIKAVQGDSGHAQADMVTEVYGHILNEDRRKNAKLIENAFYN